MWQDLKRDLECETDPDIPPRPLKAVLVWTLGGGLAALVASLVLVVGESLWLTPFFALVGAGTGYCLYRFYRNLKYGDGFWGMDE
jgi:hypothetical protein